MPLLARIPRRPLLLLAFASAVVAALDMAVALTYWCVFKDAAPIRILHGIAAALLGRDAASAGGLATATLGAAIHLALAAAMVVGYWAAARRWSPLLAHPLLGGLGWGLLTWAAMMFVVLPLSAIGGGTSTDPVWRVLHLASHLFIVGLPSAWLARRVAGAR